MKRFVIISLLLAIILCFSACQAGAPADVSVPDIGTGDTSHITYDHNYIDADDGGVRKGWTCPENSIYRFLTDSNYEGKYLLSDEDPSGEMAEGNLPDAETVVQDERNIKNTEITLSFSAHEPYVMYLLAIEESGKETLVLITYDGGISDNSLVLVCETDFGDGESFYNTVYGEKPFTAKVLADFNVTAFHARYRGVLRAYDQEDLLVTEGKEENPNKTKYYMGYFGNPNDYKFGNFMFSNLLPDDSAPDNDALVTVERVKELLSFFGEDGILK